MKNIFLIGVFSVAILIALTVFASAINYFYAKYHAAMWHERMANELSPSQLAEKYPEIICYQSKQRPNSQWCYIVKKDLIPMFFLGHEMVFYKDDKKHLLAYWRGTPQYEEYTYRHLIDVAETAASYREKISVNNTYQAYESIKVFLKNKGFKSYNPDLSTDSN